MANILVIDDNLDICQLLKRFLTKKGHEVDTTLTGPEGIDLIKSKNYDLVLCDFKLRKMEGREILQQVKTISPETKVAIITGYADVRIAVEVMKKGAFDYVVKPLIPDEILSLIEWATKEPSNVALSNTQTSSSQITTARKNTTNPDYIWGKDKASSQLLNEVSLVAPTNFSVIIYGESGSGKENIARTIHEMSERKGKPFVAIDCGALTKELAGSELWGHEKGGFTGAVSAKPGQFEIADGGSIFLDEISNLSYETQVGLLRLVQEKKLRRIGAIKDKEIDVRIIVASNEDLREAVKIGKFREDLYYRFNEFTINVPPLRNRGSDIMEFANHFLELANGELNKNVSGFSTEVVNLFSTYDWPGNLREMRNVIRRSLLLTDKGEIKLSCIPQEIVHSSKFTFADDESKQQEASNKFGTEDVQAVPKEKTNEPINLKDIAANAEAQVIKKVLEETHYNKTKAAQQLGIDRKTLFNKLKQHNIQS